MTDDVSYTPIELPGLKCQLDFPAERSFYVGKGLSLYLGGWAFHPADRIKRLFLIDGGQRHMIQNHSWARTDVAMVMYPDEDPNGNSLLSGFSTVLLINEISAPETRHLVLCAELRSGEVVEKPLGTIEFLPGSNRRPIQVNWPDSGSKVAICMAAYNPPFHLMTQQISSIKDQDHKNWVCIITDDSSDSESSDNIYKLIKNDDRFVYFKNAERKGFYHNFEECLSHVPVEADFIALADQDDRWDPDKISKLMNGISHKHQLVFSDCRIVNDNRIVSDTFWKMRKNHYDNFLSLFLANTIIGAASLFRESLLDKILPFPQRIADAYHDQWIGLSAHVSGGISYVNEPLYNYSQHTENVIGHETPRASGLLASIVEIWKHRANQEEFLGVSRRVVQDASASFGVAVQKALFAETILLRSPDMLPVNAKIVRRMKAYRTSLTVAARLRASAALTGRSTLNVEGFLLNAAVGTRARNSYYRLRKDRFLEAQQLVPSLGSDVPLSNQSLTSDEEQAPSLNDMSIKWIFHGISPLKLQKSQNEPKRINILLATIDFRYIFGGYIGMFSLALRLCREGFAVRIILLEQTEIDLDVWRRSIKRYPVVAALFDEAEIIYRFDRHEAVSVSPDDRFVATNGWGAHVAHHASRELGQDRFLFMVQEYEPYFMPMDTISALFQQSYRFPQFDLFSTYQLRDFFKQNKFGVFSQPGAAQNHAVFQNAIQKFTPSLDDMAGRERRILFYARPEAHAARNLFELGMKALSELALSPDFDDKGWKFYGMGSIGGLAKVRLAPNVIMELLPKSDLQGYVERLPRHDVGLSLMLTPHPSLVPLEMASAGMWTVTNTFANKTADSLREISTNILAVEPTLEGVVEGLKDAVSRVDDVDARLAGAQVNWPTDWNDAFPPAEMKKVLKFLG